MANPKVTARVAQLYNKYIVKQSRPVDSSDRRNLTAQEKKQLDNLESKWQSGNVGMLQGVTTERGVVYKSVPGGGTGKVAGIVGGVAQFKPGYQGVTTREGVAVEGTNQRSANVGARELLLRQTDQPGAKESPFFTRETVYVDKKVKPVSEVQPVQQKAKIKDISIRETFFPTQGTRVERGLRDEREEGKVLGQEFIEQKFWSTADIITEPVSKSISIKPVKEFLSYKVPAPRITDIVKFAFFEPALLTSNQALSMAISKGGLKPVTETQFKAVIEPKKGLSDVKVVSETTSPFGKVMGGSRELVKDLSDEGSFGVGKGIVSRRLSQGILSKEEIIKTEFIGASKGVGEARLVKQVGDIKLSESAGEGVFGRTFVKETDKYIRELRLKPMSPNKLFVKRKYISPEGNLKDFVSPKISSMKQDIHGVLLPKDENLILFVGKKGKPITSISKEGIKYKLKEPDILGTIKISNIDRDASSSLVSIGKTKTSLKQVSSLKTPAVDSAIKQVAGLTKTADTQITKSIAEITKPFIIPKFIVGKKEISIQKEIPQTKSILLTKPALQKSNLQGLTFTKTNLPITKLSTSSKSLIGQSYSPSLRSKLKTKQELNEEQKNKQLIKQKTLQSQKIKQEQKLSLGLRTILKPRTTSRIKLSGINLKPKLKFSPPLFDINLEGKTKKKKKKKGKGYEDIGFAEGFTSRVLGLKPIRIKESDVLKYSSEPLSIRRPIIINQNRRKKR